MPAFSQKPGNPAAGIARARGNPENRAV